MQLAAQASRKKTAGRDALIYDAAIEFIEQHRDGPFYINVWGHVSHHKVDPPQRYVDKFRDLVIDESKFAVPMLEKFAACKAQGGDVNEHMRNYLADIHSLDEDVGRLLKRLDELGLRDNTIVIFSSDQGSAPIRNDGQLLTKKAPSQRILGSMRWAITATTAAVSTACSKEVCACLGSFVGLVMFRQIESMRSPSSVVLIICQPCARSLV